MQHQYWLDYFNVGDSWRLFRIMSEFVEGFYTLSGVKGPAVSFFGSARTPSDDPYYKLTVAIAAELSRNGYSIITGGGPGIMEAANKGAADIGGNSIGLNINLPFEQGHLNLLDKEPLSPNPGKGHICYLISCGFELDQFCFVLGMAGKKPCTDPLRLPHCKRAATCANANDAHD